MSYERPFEEWQAAWLRRLSDLIGKEEGQEIYMLRVERNYAREEATKLRRLIKDFIQSYDNRDHDHKNDFSHEAWKKYEKAFRELRSIANQ